MPRLPVVVTVPVRGAVVVTLVTVPLPLAVKVAQSEALR